MGRVVYIRDLYSAMNIPLKRDQGLSLALDRAEAVAKGTLSADVVEGDGLHRTVRDTHVVWALSDSLATCVSAGLNVRPHLSQINTGSTDFGTPASGFSKEIFFKDFEAELWVAAALLRGGLPVKFFEDPNDPRGDMLVGNIVLEVKHPNSIGQLEKLLSKFHGQLRDHDDRGVFVVALEDAFAMSSIDFSDQSEYDTWRELRDAQIEGFGRPFLDRVFRKSRIGALVQTSSLVKNIEGKTNFERTSTSIVFDQRDYPKSDEQMIWAIAKVFNPAPAIYSELEPKDASRGVSP